MLAQIRKGEIAVEQGPGLRSYDNRMPEEHNRVVADHLSNLLLAPTSGSVANLEREGSSGDRVGSFIEDSIET